MFIGVAADWLYDVWAENRLKITGRGDLAELLRLKGQELRAAEPITECDSDGCGIDYSGLDDPEEPKELQEQNA